MSEILELLIMTNSHLNMPLHFDIDGSSPLNNHIFLFFRILQHMIIMMSIAKGTPSLLLICLVALASLSLLHSPQI
jgi:hypothetical protein